MSRIRSGHNPNDWRDEGPSGHRTYRRPWETMPAVNIAEMRPIIVGSVLSMTRDHATDGAHAEADARLRRAYSIHPEQRR